MKNKVKSIVAGILLTCLMVISGLVTLVFFPQPLFAAKMEYKHFIVYSSCKIDDDKIFEILDNAYELIEQSPLHDAHYQFKIFFTHDNIFNHIEGLQGKGPIARVTAGNIIVKVKPDIQHNLVRSATSRVNLTELLAHEMVHCLQTNKYGIKDFNPLNHPPYWKLEGYPEYVSRQTLLKNKHYNLGEEIKRFTMLEKASGNGLLEVSEEHFVPAVYYKGRLMVEYLMDVKGYTYDSILRDTRTPDEIFDEMLSVYGSGKRAPSEE